VHCWTNKNIKKHFSRLRTLHPSVNHRSRTVSCPASVRSKRFFPSSLPLLQIWSWFCLKHLVPLSRHILFLLRMWSERRYLFMKYNLLTKHNKLMWNEHWFNSYQGRKSHLRGIKVLDSLVSLESEVYHSMIDHLFRVIANHCTMKRKKRENQFFESLHSCPSRTSKLDRRFSAVFLFSLVCYKCCQIRSLALKAAIFFIDSRLILISVASGSISRVIL
jgi:hypothetical protein